jgi:hypothetical protein
MIVITPFWASSPAQHPGHTNNECQVLYATGGEAAKGKSKVCRGRHPS